MPADKKTLVPIWLTQEVVLCAVAKMAMSYNVICIDLTLDIMADIYDETDSQEDVVSVALIAGMIIGQLGLGFLGDIIGRTKALLITLCLAIFGSLGSTLLSFDPDPFIWIAVWRFFMGIGCGGVYPLAATIAKESVEDKELQGTAVSFVFSMQGIGYILSPAITLLICSTVSDKNLQWRLVLGAGAVLLLAVAWVFYWLPPRARPNKLLDAAQSSGAGQGLAHLWQLARTPEYVRMLLGTAGCWFLFDFVFYGNTIFQSVVLDDVFGGSESTEDLAAESLVVYAVALPGYYTAVALMSRLGPKFIQLQGFSMMAFLFVFIGVAWGFLSNYSVVLFLLYCGTYFFSNFGPNSTSFILPSLTFPADVRSSFNGFAAASGKTGALLGSCLFDPMSSWIGTDNTLIVCGAVALAGLLLTAFFVDAAELERKSMTDGLSQDLISNAQGTAADADREQENV